MTDDCSFADIGIDSLLSLVISSRFREELDLDIELEDLFTKYPVVADLKAFLGPAFSNNQSATSDIEATAAGSGAEDDQLLDDIGSGNFEAALAIIAEESGVSVTELTDDCLFSDIGIDSLLSLVILSRFREELGVDMDLESVFTDYPDVKHLRSLFADPEPKEATSSSTTETSDEESRGLPPTTPQSSESDREADSRPKQHPVPPTWSVILQGTPKKADQTLFFFPDGAGTATSYSQVGRLGTQTCVIALNSPFRKNPEVFKCTLDELITSYIGEVRRRQPSGPYHLGGWSAGGILAYRAAQMLTEVGETVHTLILIDSPVPEGLDQLPQRFYDFCNETHLFGQLGPIGGNNILPEWLVPHFNATIDVLHEYIAKPFAPGKSPAVSLLWACETVLDGVNGPKLDVGPNDPDDMKFLTEKRTDFSAGGWGDLFPGVEVIVEKAEGAHHFSMMVGSLHWIFEVAGAVTDNVAREVTTLQN